MKTFMIIVAGSMLSLSQPTPVIAGGDPPGAGPMSLWDLKEERKKRHQMARMQQAQDKRNGYKGSKSTKRGKNHEKDHKFQGKGHVLGGDPYVNKLLGISHDTGLALEKFAKHPKKYPNPLFRKDSSEMKAKRRAKQAYTLFKVLAKEAAALKRQQSMHPGRPDNDIMRFIQANTPRAQ